MPPAQLEIQLDSPLTTVATFGETLIVAVYTELTMESLRLSRALNAKLSASYEGGVVSLTIVHPHIVLPDSTMRGAASEVMAATRSRTRAVARVFLGDGFWLSTVRSVLTAIELLRPYDVPRRTFGELSQSTRWLAQTIHETSAWATRLDDALGQLALARNGVREAVAT